MAETHLAKEGIGYAATRLSPRPALPPLRFQRDAQIWTPRGKQTYRCGDCKHRYTPEGNRHYYSEAVKGQAVSMYPEGSRLSAIGRVLQGRLETVYSWIKKSRSSPDDFSPGPGTASGGAAGRGSGGGHFPGLGVDLPGLPQGQGAAGAVDLDGGSGRS